MTFIIIYKYRVRGTSADTKYIEILNNQRKNLVY